MFCSVNVLCSNTPLINKRYFNSNRKSYLDMLAYLSSECDFPYRNLLRKMSRFRLLITIIRKLTYKKY